MAKNQIQDVTNVPAAPIQESGTRQINLSDVIRMLDEMKSKVDAIEKYLGISE